MSPEAKQQLIALVLGIVFIIGFILFAQRLGRFLRGRQQRENIVSEQVSPTPTPKAIAKSEPGFFQRLFGGEERKEPVSEQVVSSPTPTPSQEKGPGILLFLQRLFGGKKEKAEVAQITPTPKATQSPTPTLVQPGIVLKKGAPTIIPETGAELPVALALFSLFGAGMALRSRKP